MEDFFAIPFSHTIHTKHKQKKFFIQLSCLMVRSLTQTILKCEDRWSHHFTQSTSLLIIFEVHSKISRAKLLRKSKKKKAFAVCLSQAVLHEFTWSHNYLNHLPDSYSRLFSGVMSLLEQQLKRTLHDLDHAELCDLKLLNPFVGKSFYECRSRVQNVVSTYL